MICKFCEQLHILIYIFSNYDLILFHILSAYRKNQYELNNSEI